MTGSMEPSIKEKECILIKECENYEINDIVTYVDVYENLITHRILEMSEKDFITKGDNNDISDESTDIRNIQGKVVYHSKILGIFILYYLKIIIVIYVLILMVLYGKEKNRKEPVYEKKEERISHFDN